MKTININTVKRNEMVDISSEIQSCINSSGVKDGIVCVFVPHTTAGITINENADPDVVKDVLFAYERMVPNSGFDHMEGNSDAHTKAQMTGFSLTVIVSNGRLVLGTWQSVYFCEYDGPRRRRVNVKVVDC